MYRKLIASLFIISLLGMAFAVSADPNANTGCYVDAPSIVDEGASIPVYVTCNAGDTQVYGFQFGTSQISSKLTPGSADSTAATAPPSVYTVGAVVPGTSDWTTAVFGGGNSMSLYALSHQQGAFSTGTFNIGSYAVTAVKGLTGLAGANGSATITISGTDGHTGFKLSDNVGAASEIGLQALADMTVTINNTPLALLSGNVTVISDGIIQHLSGLNVTLHTNASNLTVVNSDFGPMDSLTTDTFRTFSVGNLEYTAADDSDGTNNGQLGVNVTASMDSHLDCSSTAYPLVDGADDAATQIGTVTLLAGDVSASGSVGINVSDATEMGTSFNTAIGDGAYVTADDINQDGKIDIYDLVHVGRNYTAMTADCKGNILSNNAGIE